MQLDLLFKIKQIIQCKFMEMCHSWKVQISLLISLCVCAWVGVCVCMGMCIGLCVCWCLCSCVHLNPHEASPWHSVDWVSKTNHLSHKWPKTVPGPPGLTDACPFSCVCGAWRRLTASAPWSWAWSPGVTRSPWPPRCWPRCLTGGRRTSCSRWHSDRSCTCRLCSRAVGCAP